MRKLFIFLTLCITALLFISARSSQWRKVRKEHVRLHPVCEACGTIKKLEVHHIIPYAEDPALELEPSNLITLCKRCHFCFGHFYSYKLYNPNVRADAAWYKERKNNFKVIDGNPET